MAVKFPKFDLFIYKIHHRRDQHHQCHMLLQVVLYPWQELYLQELAEAIFEQQVDDNGAKEKTRARDWQVRDLDWSMKSEYKNNTQQIDSDQSDKLSNSIAHETVAKDGNAMEVCVENHTRALESEENVDDTACEQMNRKFGEQTDATSIVSDWVEHNNPRFLGNQSVSINELDIV